MFNTDTRLRELGSKAVEGVITDEEFAELVQLSKAKQELREGRVVLIAELRQTLQSRDVTIDELFSAAEIAAALPRDVALARPVVRAKTAVPVRERNAARPWVLQQTGPVLIDIPKYNRGGVPCRYCKGQPLRYYVPKTLKLLNDGQLEANLARHYTEQGREYFATDEGRVELAKLVTAIRSHPMKQALTQQQGATHV